MLILARKQDQSITLIDREGVYPDVTIEVVKGGRASLGIDAPPRIKVMRSELMQPNESEASHSAPEVSQ